MISVVIPIYNVDKYLDSCLKSIEKQSYKNFEAILVNDGSTDTSREICEQYVKKDSRFRLINKVNGGLSSARNAGLSEAHGEFVCFIDSDDFIAENFLELLLKRMKEDNSDICACNFYFYYSNKKIVQNRSKNNIVLSNKEAIRDFLLNGEQVEVMTWNKLYKTELFKKNNIVFPFGKINEDNFTTYKLLYYSKRISIISECLYYYVQRDGSIMNKSFNTKNFDILEAFTETKEFLNSKECNFQSELDYYEFEIYFRLLNKMICSNDNKYNYICKEFLDKNKKKIMDSIYLKRNEKVALKIYYLNFKFYRLFRQIYTILKKFI